MSQDDSGFFKVFVIVFGALVLFTIFIAVIANIYSPESDRATDPLVQNEVARQIAPVGRSRVADVAEPAQPAVEPQVQVQPVVSQAPAAADPVPVDDAPAVDAAVMTTETADISVRVRAVVATNCAGCHREGLHGAPRSDDAEAWKALQQQGLEKLTASVINGKGTMLPRVETSLNDDELAAAVQLMIAQATGGDVAAAVMPASPQPVAAVAANDAVAAAPAAVVATASEIPAEVKSVVDSLCASCHIAGVADAPKFGDKVAWDQRMALGMDKVLASAIAGKGAMPPRGGSALSDTELRQAIEYMATK